MKGKRIAKEFLDWGLVVFLLPQLFLFFYYFPLLFKRQANWLSLVASLSRYGLSISWVSVPFFTILYAAVRCCFCRRISGLRIWGLSFLLGGGWVLLWNWTIFPTFGFWQSLLPLLLCSSFACLYAVAGHLYREGAVIEAPFEYHEHLPEEEERTPPEAEERAESGEMNVE